MTNCHSRQLASETEAQAGDKYSVKRELGCAFRFVSLMQARDHEGVGAARAQIEKTYHRAGSVSRAYLKALAGFQLDLLDRIAIRATVLDFDERVRMGGAIAHPGGRAHRNRGQ